MAIPFFFLTFIATWLLWLAPAAIPGGRTGVFALGGPVFLLGVFAPGLVAIGLTALRAGTAGVSELLSQVTRWDASWRLYAFALGYMTIVRLSSAAIVRVWTGAWPPFGTTPYPLLLAATLVSTWAQAGEEIGWRGYALPRLAERLGVGPASLLLGAIWAAWHLPLFFIPGTGSDGQSFPLYLLYVTAISAAMGWLYERSAGSLLLVMLMHAAVNNTSAVVPSTLPEGHAVLSLRGSRVAWVSVALMWIVAVWCLARTWGVRRIDSRRVRA